MRSPLLSTLQNIRHEFAGPGDADPIGLTRCRQVHGDSVVLVENQPPENFRALEADGLLTFEPRTIGVMTADCIPALFAAKDGRAVAAVHAGWRGLHKGILQRAVERFARSGVVASDLVVSLGPAIGACCFEVSREVVDSFERDWSRLWLPGERPWWSAQPAGRPAARERARPTASNLWVDLKAIARLQLLEAGMAADSVADLGVCTYCGPGELASYRRGTHIGTPAGRQWSWIARLPDST